MDTLFINAENGNLTDKIDLRRGEKSVALSNLSIYYTWKNIKISYNNNKFKISAPTWNNNLNYLMDHIIYQIFKIILNILKKNMKKRFKYM